MKLMSPYNERVYNVGDEIAHPVSGVCTIKEIQPPYFREPEQYSFPGRVLVTTLRGEDVLVYAAEIGLVFIEKP
jgi:hypothetical protein